MAVGANEADEADGADVADVADMADMADGVATGDVVAMAADGYRLSPASI